MNQKLKQLTHTQSKEIMYEVLEHWKQYKVDNEAKELQKKIALK